MKVIAVHTEVVGVEGSVALEGFLGKAECAGLSLDL